MRKALISWASSIIIQDPCWLPKQESERKRKGIKVVYREPITRICMLRREMG